MMPIQTALTTSIVTSRDPKGLKFMQNCEAVYNKASLDGNRAQRLNENPKFTKGLAVLIGKHSQIDDHFEEIGSFEVTVPANYDHTTCLDTFGKEHRKEFYHYNKNLTDKNFSKATTKLTPGRKFKVKVFQIKEQVSSDDCLVYLKSQKAVLVGAQGASLAYEQANNKFSVSRWSISFDEKQALPSVDGYHRVPSLYRASFGDFKFDLVYFGRDWYDDFCLLCFCDLEKSSDT